MAIYLWCLLLTRWCCFWCYLFFFLSFFLVSPQEQNHTKKAPNKFQFCILPLLGYLFMTLH
jgi:hypothetical protein